MIEAYRLHGMGYHILAHLERQEWVVRQRSRRVHIISSGVTLGGTSTSVC